MKKFSKAVTIPYPELTLIKEIEKSHPLEIIHRGSSLKQIDIILGNADMPGLMQAFGPAVDFTGLTCISATRT